MRPKPRPGLLSLKALIPRGDCINAAQRKGASVGRLMARTSGSLVAVRLTLPARAGLLRLYPPTAPVRTDSLAEGTGFELTVPSGAAAL